MIATFSISLIRHVLHTLCESALFRFVRALCDKSPNLTLVFRIEDVNEGKSLQPALLIPYHDSRASSD